MSSMLEPDEVDEEYFTPVASATLASIFKDDPSRDAAVNSSLKYRPPQPKKPVPISKLEDPNTSQCVFSCSIIAYEWIQETHICKGKVGFAIVKVVKTGLCKIILYSQDKATLSCTTVVPQLEVTLKGAMISLYDDHKKYWGLCFNGKIIEQVKELLKSEKVIIKNYPEFKPAIRTMENVDCGDATDEIDHNNMVEDNMSPSRNDKASILNRIANVGHAILPSLPESPVQKSIPVDVLSIADISKSIDELNVLSEGNSNKHSPNNASPQHQAGNNTSTQCQQPPNNVAVQSNVKMGSYSLLNNTIQNAQTSYTSVPLVNNQLFTYVNGYIVPLHVQVPVLNKVEHTDASAEFDQVIQKLTHLQGVVRAMEIMNNFHEELHAHTCKSQKLLDDTTINNLKDENKKLLKKISELEDSIREKDILCNSLKLQQAAQNEIENNSNLKDQLQHQQMIEKSNQDENTKNFDDMIPIEAGANAIKNLMNDTFRSLASNFEDEISYNGNNVKAVLAAIIKKNTLESLGVLLGKQNSSNTTTKTPE